jgi:hypothetical protein
MEKAVTALQYPFPAQVLPMLVAVVLTMLVVVQVVVVLVHPTDKELLEVQTQVVEAVEQAQTQEVLTAALVVQELSSLNTP